MMQELNNIRCGDYHIPDIHLPEENRPIGRWGRMYRDYIKEHNPIRFNDLCLNGELWTYLADLNEQVQNHRLELIVEQMKAAECVTEDMKQHDQMAWVGAMNSILLFLIKAKPVLAAMFAWANSRTAAPKSALGKAFTYLKEQRPYLVNYLKDGRLEISTNRVAHYFMSERG